MLQKQRTYLYACLPFIERTVSHASVSLHVSKVKLGAQIVPFELQIGSPRGRMY